MDFNHYLSPNIILSLRSKRLKDFTEHELSKIFGAYISIILLYYPNGGKINHPLETNQRSVQNHQQLMGVVLLQCLARSLQMKITHFASYYHKKKM
jgi:hypothetical protein